MRWLPHRPFIFVGDPGYGPSETARFCRPHHRHLPVVSKFDGDAALYEPPPPRRRPTMGRPGGEGQELPPPQAGVAHRTNRPRLAVAWDGGSTRDIETGTGHWSRIGEAWVALRWGFGHEGTGPPRDESLFTTPLCLRPQQRVEYYTQRWSIGTTSQDCRAHLEPESTKCDGQQTGLRCTPC